MTNGIPDISLLTEKPLQWVLMSARAHWHDYPFGMLAALAVGGWAFLVLWQRFGFLAQNLAPKLAKLEKQLSGQDPHLQVGDDCRRQIEAIAAAQGKPPRGTLAALAWFNRWYSPQPFSKEALDKAVTYAIMYSAAFWVLPWLFTGTGRLGDAALLSSDVPWSRRLLLTAALTMVIPFALALGRWTWAREILRMGWRGYLKPKTIFGATVICGALAFFGSVVMAWGYLGGEGAFAFAVSFHFIAMNFVFRGLHDPEARVLARGETGAPWTRQIGALFRVGFAERLGVHATLVPVAFLAVLSFPIALLSPLSPPTSGPAPNTPSHEGLSIPKDYTSSKASSQVLEWDASSRPRWLDDKAEAELGHMAITGATCIVCIFGAQILMAMAILHARSWIAITAFHCGYLFALSSSPMWVDMFISVNDTWSRLEKVLFTILFFSGWLPLLNGIFDCVSIGLTQIFLRKMQEGAWTLAWWILDGLTSVGLVISLYILVFGILQLLNAFGWDVDPRGIFLQFQKDLTSSSWLILLAITNLVPTLLHWALGLTAVLESRGTPEASDLQRWAKKVLDGIPLGEGNAEAFAFYLMGGNKIASLSLALGLICLFVQVFQWAIPAGFKWLLA